eukprot:scaffold270390_cov24-Tisochrysis_lutea.AAC.1
MPQRQPAAGAPSLLQRLPIGSPPPAPPSSRAPWRPPRPDPLLAAAAHTRRAALRTQLAREPAPAPADADPRPTAAWATRVTALRREPHCSPAASVQAPQPPRESPAPAVARAPPPRAARSPSSAAAAACSTRRLHRARTR